MKIFLIVPLLLSLGACSTVDRVENIIRPVIENANDKALDKIHKAICNNTYRAEMDFITRHNLDSDTFKKFCARGNGETR